MSRGIHTGLVLVRESSFFLSHDISRRDKVPTSKQVSHRRNFILVKDKQCSTMNEENEFLRPFEWLTDAPSVIPVVQPFLSSLPEEDANAARILHVGSGSSVLGEYMVESLGDSIELVVNVDLNSDMLQRMEAQWKRKHKDNERVARKLQFTATDFAENVTDRVNTSFPNGYFHLAVDKGTLDCTLCSDTATAGLLSEVYRVLHPQGGTYVVVSFHHFDLLRPLLENLPGAEWDVSCQKMNRQMDDLAGTNNGRERNSVQTTDCVSATTSAEEKNGKKTGVAWASGKFEPDEQYIKTLSIVICRRRGHADDLASNSVLDLDALMEHVNKTNDKWFKEESPMLTENRKKEIRQLFQERNQHSQELQKIPEDALVCDVKVAYEMIFTDAERVHFTYDLFLEDWDAWLEKKCDPSLSRDSMSLTSALKFLEEMQ